MCITIIIVIILYIDMVFMFCGICNVSHENEISCCLFYFIWHELENDDDDDEQHAKQIENKK